MTVSTNDNREDYSGNDSTTVFPYGFKIFSDSDLVVIVTDSDGNETTKTLTTDYTVSGAGDASGGNVTYPVSGSPLATGETLTILREVDVTQETAFRNQGSLYLEALETALDRVVMICQQLFEKIGRALTKTDGASGNYDAGGAKIANLGTPTESTDAATVGHVATYVASVNSGDVGDATQVTAQDSGPADKRTLANWMKQVLQNVADVAGLKAKEGNEFVQQTGGNRSVIQYKSAQEVRLFGREFAMCGFRFMGEYLKAAGKVYSASASPTAVSLVTDLGCQSAVSSETFYAVFAVANEADANCQFKAMPFIRLNNVVGSTGDFGLCGENSKRRTAGAKTMNIAANALDGVDCLVVSETIDGRPAAMSGRVTTVASNTTTSITLSDAGTVADFDYLLCAPPGFDHYRYLGTFYRDTAEVRNMADSGGEFLTRGIFLSGAPFDGVLAAPVEVDVAGIISPLATGVRIVHGDTYGTASTGDLLVEYGQDSAHMNNTVYGRKDLATTMGFTWTFPNLAFAHQQRVFLDAGAAMNIAATTRKIHIRGWVEL